MNAYIKVIETLTEEDALFGTIVKVTAVETAKGIIRIGDTLNTGVTVRYFSSDGTQVGGRGPKGGLSWKATHLVHVA